MYVHVFFVTQEFLNLVYCIYVGVWCVRMRSDSGRVHFALRFLWYLRLHKFNHLGSTHFHSTSLSPPFSCMSDLRLLLTLVSFERLLKMCWPVVIQTVLLAQYVRMEYAMQTT